MALYPLLALSLLISSPREHPSVPARPPAKPPVVRPGAAVTPGSRSPFSPIPSAAPKPPAPPRSLLIGLNANWSSDRTNWGRLTSLLKSSGATITTVEIRWDAIERNPGVYDWSATDRLLRLLKAQGFVLVVTVNGTPTWASGVGGSALGHEYEVAPSPNNIPALTRLGKALAARYKDIVHRWQLRNAPDAGGLVTTAGKPAGPQIYAKMLQAFAQGVRSVDAGSLIAVGPLERLRADFLTGLYAAGARPFFDAVSLSAVMMHEALPIDWIEACRQVLVRHGDDKKRIWLARYGWTLYPDDPLGIVPGEAPRRLRTAQAEIKLRPYIESACLESANDGPGESDGLMDSELRPRPGWQAFALAARGILTGRIRPKPIALLGGDAPTGEPANIEIAASPVSGALPKLWRAVSLIDGLPDVPSGAATRMARTLAREGVMIRVAAPNLQGGAAAERTLRVMAGEGVKVILSLTPKPSMTTQAWTAAVEAAIDAYGKDPRYGVERWELSISAAGDLVQIAKFVWLIREARPGAPIALEAAPSPVMLHDLSIAALGNDKRPIAFDSFAWRLPADPVQAGEQMRMIREAVSHTHALSNATLWPELDIPEGASGVSTLATVARLIDASAPGGRNAIGGIVVPTSALWTDDYRETSELDALRLLNTASGLRLSPLSDDSGVRCLAARQADGSVTAICWREPGYAAISRFAVLRLTGLSPLLLSGVRLDVTQADERPPFGPAIPLTPVESDWRPNPVTRGLDVPVALSTGSFVRVRIQPRRPTGIQLSTEAPRFGYLGGDEIELLITAHNGSTTNRNVSLTLSASDPAMVPSVLRTVAIGAIPPGKSRAVRLRLPAPFRMGDETPGIEIAGSDARAALIVHVAPSIVAELDPPRQDSVRSLDSVRFSLRVTNRSPEPALLNVVRRSEGRSDDEVVGLFAAPSGGQTVVKAVELRAPSGDPGLYSIPLTLLAATKPIASLEALIGVPLTCRYADTMPVIDGDLRDWANAEPMGMGRREQVRGKEWGGPNDLSAYAYLKWDAKFLYFACAVTDDIFYQPFTGADLWKGDSVLLALTADRGGSGTTRPMGPSDNVFGIALEGGRTPVIYRLSGDGLTRMAPVPRAVVAVRRSRDRVYYEAAIPWSELSPIVPHTGTTFGATVTVVDNDGQGAGSISWGSGVGVAAPFRPGRFAPVRLER